MLDIMRAFPSLTGLWFFLAAIVTLIVHSAFALAVYRDGAGLKGRTGFVGPAMWGLATFLGGVLVATAYWLIHYSGLSTSAKKRSAAELGHTESTDR